MTPDNALQKLLDGNKRFASQITQNRNIAEESPATPPPEIKMSMVTPSVPINRQDKG